MSYWKSQRCISLTPNVTTLKLRQMLVKIAIPRLTKLTKNKVLFVKSAIFYLYALICLQKCLNAQEYERQRRVSCTNPFTL